MKLEAISTDNIRNSVLLPFVSETINVLQTMANLKGSSDLLTYHEPLDVFAFKDFAVSINATFTNGVTNNVVMNFDAQTAIVIGNKVRSVMFGTNEVDATLNEANKEALAEFLNTVVGLATREINETNHKISFGVPLYLYNKEDSAFLLDGVKNIMTVPLDLEDSGRFYLSFLVR
ncbi:MAG: chemotaxis protein CheX [Thiotrichaceae bacterium]|nr:chemotaxis protein CheX [Thiotrichaceae bacterium]